jgi:hypothetical protein
MTWKTPALVFVAIILSGIAYADTSVYYSPGGVASGTTGKKTGNVISVITDADIAANCDFTRQIVVTRTSILCVYNGYVPAATT